MNDIKKYNYKNIYKLQNAKKLSQNQCDTIIYGIYNNYLKMYKGKDTISSLQNSQNPYTKNFKNWLIKYTDSSYRNKLLKNEIIYDISNPDNYKQAIVDYIFGMTDKYAIKTYNSITS